VLRDLEDVVVLVDVAVARGVSSRGVMVSPGPRPSQIGAVLLLLLLLLLLFG